MLQSIKTRFFLYYTLIVLSGIVLLAGLVIIFTRVYLYNTIEELTDKQLNYATDQYNRYLIQDTLENVTNKYHASFSYANSEIQVLNNQGEILLYTFGQWDNQAVTSPDVQKALQGQRGKWIGRLGDSKIHAMMLSVPLYKDKNIVGVLRFITPLSKVDEQILRFIILFVLIGLLVGIIAVISGYLLTETITVPLNQLTKTATAMANGNLQIRNQKKYNDEVGLLSDTMNDMADEIVKKENQKNEFFSSVSHELRTPLTSIRGWADTLNNDQYTQGNEELKDGLSIISEESRRLQTMVEQLLDVARLLNKGVCPELQRIDIVSLIKNVLTGLKPWAQRDNIAMVFDEDCQSIYMHIDVNGVKQVLINLLDNALKFTNTGGVIRIDLRDSGEFLDIVLEDNGVGISPEDLPKVKGRYYRGKTGRSHMGIGLSVCDAIILAHHGRLDIKSEVNRGTVVTISLPR